jgi:hypothetical protein
MKLCRTRARNLRGADDVANGKNDSGIARRLNKPCEEEGNTGRMLSAASATYRLKIWEQLGRPRYIADVALNCWNPRLAAVNQKFK